MPKFFVPIAKDGKDAERIWQATREFMRRHGFQTTNRKIYSLSYTHNGKDFVDTVGEKDRYGVEIIQVILETSSGYLTCTVNRGVFGGEPILMAKGEETFETEFDPDGNHS